MACIKSWKSSQQLTNQRLQYYKSRNTETKKLISRQHYVIGTEVKYNINILNPALPPQSQLSHAPPSPQAPLALPLQNSSHHPLFHPPHPTSQYLSHQSQNIHLSATYSRFPYRGSKSPLHLQVSSHSEYYPTRARNSTCQDPKPHMLHAQHRRQLEDWVACFWKGQEGRRASGRWRAGRCARQLRNLFLDGKRQLSEGIGMSFLRLDNCYQG